MLFIEVFVQRGALSAEQRNHIGQRLIDVMSEASAPAEVIETWREIVQVVIHEPETWMVGGRAVAPDEPPRYVVRVSVPGAWRKEMSAEALARITRVLTDADADPQRLYQEPHAWVQIIGIAEGSYGAFGQVLRSTDIVKMVTKSFREASEGDFSIQDSAPDSAIDPICGMTVALNDTALTLEHAGATYAFCSTGCRAVFAEQLRAASPE